MNGYPPLTTGYPPLFLTTNKIIANEIKHSTCASLSSCVRPRGPSAIYLSYVTKKRDMEQTGESLDMMKPRNVLNERIEGK